MVWSVVLLGMGAVSCPPGSQVKQARVNDLPSRAAEREGQLPFCRSTGFTTGIAERPELPTIDDLFIESWETICSHFE
jgi:hypothetical protein